MTCARCQTINPEGTAACASCGAPLVLGAPYGAPSPYYPPPGYPPPGYPPSGYVMMQPAATRTSGMAIAGFVLSFLYCLAILGLIFSLIGLNEVKKSGGQVTGGGLAVAGIVISSLWMLLFLIGFVAAASSR